MASQTDEAQKTCTYISTQGKRCEHRTLVGNPFCAMHVGNLYKSGENPFEGSVFQNAFDSLIAVKQGNWEGFAFPRGVQFPEEIDFPVIARGSRLNELVLNNIVFKHPVDFTDAVFHNRSTFQGVTFEDNVNFSGCRFEGAADFLHVTCRRTASFIGVDFSGHTLLRVHFEGTALFNQAIFRERVTFVGWRNISAQLHGISVSSMGAPAVLFTANRSVLRHMQSATTKASSWIGVKCSNLKRRMIKLVSDAGERYRALLRQYAKSDPNATSFHVFESEGQLQNAVFLKPEQTTFSGVDLSHVYFRGTNLRGVQFLGVNWWQPKLKRNGLYDEFFIRNSTDGPFRHEYLPILEETCRNARAALEDNRSFNVASDFYVGEMEAARAQLSFLRRHIFSVSALYRFVSNYGTNVGVALRVLGLLLILHFSCTLAIQFHGGAALSFETVSKVLLHSFKVLMQQNPATFPESASSRQEWSDAAFRVLGLIQVAMVALAFRSRIKRH